MGSVGATDDNYNTAGIPRIKFGLVGTGDGGGGGIEGIGNVVVVVVMVLVVWGVVMVMEVLRKGDVLMVGELIYTVVVVVVWL